MKRIFLLITLCVCIGLYYNNWVNKNFENLKFKDEPFEVVLHLE